MAMLPFCGYNMADYFEHWLEMGAAVTHPPRIFGVNWFRTDANGRFLWPGYGDNLRVLSWIIDRCEGRGAAVDHAIGALPAQLDLEGIEVSLTDLLTVHKEEWQKELQSQAEFLGSYGDRMPAALWAEHAALSERLGV
jgi:phosphoenolpyruvate carboxykinase (GTP)